MKFLKNIFDSENTESGWLPAIAGAADNSIVRPVEHKTVVQPVAEQPKATKPIVRRKKTGKQKKPSMGEYLSAERFLSTVSLGAMKAGQDEN